MRLPSYLQKNEYGKYYFRIVFPKQVRIYINKREYKKSLRTSDRCHAVTLARVFHLRTTQVFQLITRYKMDWVATEKLLQRISNDILSGYEEHLFVKGLYPDVMENYPEKIPEYDAHYFLEMKEAGLDYFDNSKTSVATLETTEEVDEEWAKYETLENITAHKNEDFYQHEFWMRDGGGLLSKIGKVRAVADGIIADENLEVSEEDYEDFCTKVAEMLRDLKRSRQDIITQLEQKKYVSQGKVDDVPSTVNTLVPIVTSKDSGVSSNRTITFRDLIDKYLANKKRKSRKEYVPKDDKQKYLYVYNILKCIKTSEAFCVHELNRDDANEFDEILERMPKFWNKSYPNKSIEEVVELAKRGSIPEELWISATRYNSYCTALGVIMKYAMEPRQGYVTENYFTNMRIKVVSKKDREKYTNEQLNLFFNTDLFAKKDFIKRLSWRYWIPILMVYSGARSEEIAQLQIHNIIEKDGILCLDIREELESQTGLYITKLKNKDSERLVPIHQKVLELGLMDYVHSLKKEGEEKLFPTLLNRKKDGEYKKCGGAVSKFFNQDDNRLNKVTGKRHYHKSYLTKCGINKLKENGEIEKEGRKVFYELRHTFIDLLMNHPDDIQEYKIKKLIGHHVAGNTKDYGKIRPEERKKIIDLIDYPDAKLPWDVDEKYRKRKVCWK